MSNTFPSRIKLREVAPRDGLQNVDRFVPTPQKLSVIEALATAGLGEIEITSFVSEKVIPQMRDAAEVLHGLPDAGFTRAVLVPTPKRAQEAIAAGADRLIVFLSASEAHNRANVNRSIGESVAGLETIFRVATDAGVSIVGAVAVSFGCPYEGDVPVGRVLDLSQTFRELGADALVFGDTTGMASPQRVERFVKSFQDRFATGDFSLHFHNNRGTAMTNLYAAMAAGADTFDTALGGIGGCPTVPQAAGNLATEDVVCLLDEIGIETGVDLGALIMAARSLQEVLGYPLPGQVMKSGPVDWQPAARAGRVGA
jgi:hydroxymethylglutaryl-CoA lyase